MCAFLAERTEFIHIGLITSARIRPLKRIAWVNHWLTIYVLIIRKSKGREKLFALLELVPKNSSILTIFGEIDCRAHIGRQAVQQKRPVTNIVEDVVDRYFKVILEVRNKGFNIGVWGVIPSTDFSGLNPEFPVFGTCSERNEITILFNNYLCELCTLNEVVFVSIFQRLINSDFTPKNEFWMDGNHLSQKAFPIALESINHAFGANL